MSSVLLVCAVVVSLAVGVFVAQALCTLIFRLFAIHARQVAATRISKSTAVGLETVSLKTAQN